MSSSLSCAFFSVASGAAQYREEERRERDDLREENEMCSVKRRKGKEVSGGVTGEVSERGM